MSAQPESSYSLEDWIAVEREALETRSEYVDGEVFAMTGASEAHNLIVTNLAGELSQAFKGKPCRVYANDMKILIRETNEGRYPDLVALCGEREFQDDRTDILLNPALIIEVFSRSTANHDRGEKFASYRRLPSLRQYLLVSQHEMQAERYSRLSDHRWLVQYFDQPEDRISLESVGCELRLAEIYDKVEFRADIRRGEES